MKIARLFTAAAVAALLTGCERAGSDALSVVVSLPRSDAANVAKATLLVDYSGTGARIVPEGGGPSCAFILPGIDGDFADDRKGTLTIHTRGARALHGPADIVACRMQPGSADLTAADIQAKISVRIAGAEDAAGKVIDVAVKPAKGPGAAAAGNRTEQNLETQQAEAVKTAKTTAAANPAPPAGTPAAPAGGPAAAGGAAAKPATPAAGAGAAGAPGAAAKPPTSVPPSKPPASGAGVKVPGASSAPSSGNMNDDGAIVSNQDRDPSYDDSPSNDANAPAYYVEVAVTGSPGSFGALQFEITHLGRSGGFIGNGDQVECVALVDAIVAANYVGERVAKIGMISLQGIPTPSAIVRCNFRTRESLSPASFLVEVTDASDIKSAALEPPPTVVVSSVGHR